MDKSRIIPILCIILFCITALLGIKYFYSRSGLVGNQEAKLQKIAEARKDAIISFLQDQREQAAQIGHDQQLIQLFNSLAKEFDPQQPSDAYKKEEIKVDQFFNTYKSKYNFKDAFFIRADGALFYSIKVDIVGAKELR